MDDTITVKVSGRCLRELFHPCTPTYIASVCRGRCCRGPSGGIARVHVPAEQTEAMRALGGVVTDGFLQSADGTGLCPFQNEAGFCTVHRDDQPYGCIVSPFAFTDRGTMIVRNRYRRLKCYRDAGALPAYEAHRRAIDWMFDLVEANRIVEQAAAGQNDIYATMPRRRFAALMDREHALRGHTTTP